MAKKDKDLTFGKTRYSTAYAKAIANRYKGFNLPSPKYYAGWFGFKFLQMLSKPFTDWEAYKEGLIDEDGNELRKPVGDEKEIYNYHVKLVVRLKQLIDRQIDDARRDLIYSRLFLIREGKEIDHKEIIMEIRKSENEEINQILDEATMSGDMARSGGGYTRQKHLQKKIKAQQQLLKHMTFKDFLAKKKKDKKDKK